jgi:signal transduction histidine kinase
MQHLEDGTVVYQAGTVATIGLLLVVSGRLSVRMSLDGIEREVREVLPGEVGGFLPYSRIVKATGSVYADGPSDVLMIARDDMPAMTRECYDFTAKCVHTMVDRARAFRNEDLHREKMAALGRLSAGLAHELNNPSAAMARTAAELDESRREVAMASRAVAAPCENDAGRAALQALEEAAAREPDTPLSPIALADREDHLVRWMEQRGLETDAAYVLAGTGLEEAQLDAADRALDVGALKAALRYVAAEAHARQLTRDLATAARRVHALVAAVKAHTHMDRARVPESLALGSHLRDTITLLGSKANARDVALDLAIEPDLPSVRGVVAELNHVWLNLLDNALDAAPQSGHVAMLAKADRGCVIVSVVDDGAGIAAEHIGRVFDPFFTTNDVGQGTGLGLNVVQTIVRNHGGTVDVSSRPGRTEFRVILPQSAAEI